MTLNYGVGSRIRVRLYSGKVVEAEITAITTSPRAENFKSFVAM
jgi:hypothetical protein